MNAPKVRVIVSRSGRSDALKYALQVLLGAVFGVMALNYFLDLFVAPVPAARGEELLFALRNSGYILPMLYASEFLASMLLLFNIWVPFGLVILAPIIINIFAFHLFLDPQGLPWAFALAGLEIYLAYAYWPQLKNLFENGQELPELLLRDESDVDLMAGIETYTYSRHRDTPSRLRGKNQHSPFGGKKAR